MSKSDLEDLFAFQLDACGLTGYARQYRAIKGRKFAFDFAFLDARLLIEIQGGTYSNGAHARPLGIARDYEKSNLAQLAGWRCLAFDGKAVRSGEAIEFVRKALGKK